MLSGSRYSKQKVFHYGNCRYAKRTLQKNRISFASVEQASSQGFTQCPYCNPILLEFRKHKDTISILCAEAGLKTILLNDELYVISWDDTAWRIRMKGDGSREKQLLHESKQYIKYDRAMTLYEDRKYHVQDIPGNSITGYLAYIRNHDRCEAERAKEAAIKARKKEQISQQVNSIKAVQRQISKQNRKHRKHGSAESHSQKRRRTNQQLRDIVRAFSDYRAAKEAYI